MKINSLMKILIVFLLIFSISAGMAPSYARPVPDLVPGADGPRGGNAGLAGSFKGSANEAAQKGVKPIIEMILGGLKIICLAGAVSLLMWMGVKYMLASASERADLKKNLIQYSIGAVVMFASSGILQILQSFVTTSLGS